MALALLAVSGCGKSERVAADKDAPVALVIPQTGAYTGAYIDFGEQEDTVTLDAIEEFETMVGKHQAIVASSSYWGEQTFPTPQSPDHLAARLASARLLVAVGQALRSGARARSVQPARNHQRDVG